MNKILIRIIFVALIIAVIIPIASADSWVSTPNNWTKNDGTYIYIMYNSTIITTLVIPPGVSSMDYIVVAGGGGGGYSANTYAGGGGGGAGGVINGTISTTPGTSVDVIVGEGAAAKISIGQGLSGKNSTFATINATGGGGGGAADVSTALRDGIGGGSGGGATWAGSAGTAGSGTSGQGNNGGVATVNEAGGGGGGNSSVGGNGNATFSGAGGNGGDFSTIFGTDFGINGCVAGGGSGGSFSDITIGITTCGGGTGSEPGIPASSGINGTGGGGGGGNGGITSTPGGGGNGLVIVRYLIPESPVANFTQNITYGLAPLVVMFNDTSTGSPTEWNYTAYDILTATEIILGSTNNLTYTFNNGGNYSIQLNASSSVGYNRTPLYSRWVNTTTEELVADFAANTTTGYTGAYIKFTDLTSDLPTTWNWTFGDAGTSTDQNPTHQYMTSGIYDVSLAVTNLTASNTTTKFGYITITDLPAPSALFIYANKTYSTESTFPVLFNTTEITPHFISRNLSFGDGSWYNTSVPSDNSTTHTYTAVGDYTVSLYVSNAAGTTSNVSTDFVVLSNPTLVMHPQNLPVSRGTTGLMTLRVSNLSHVDGGATNITFNKTAVTIDSITANATSSQNFTITSTIDNPGGIASIGVSCVDISSTVPSADIVDIVWRANTTKTNDTAPVSFNTTAFTSFVKSNSSYNNFKYANITYLVPGVITLTNETWMRTLYFKNAYNLNLISGIQVRISYTGIINGSDTTITGMYDLSSTYGTTSVTASADGYYNVTQSVTFAGNGTDTFLMTPLSGAPGQTTWYTPLQVELVAMNLAGVPLNGVYVSATPLDFTAPDDWAQILIGIQPSVNITGTTVDGYTGIDGSWIAPMLQSQRYKFTFRNLTIGVNETRIFYPMDLINTVYLDTSGVNPILTDRNSTYLALNGTKVYAVEPNISYVSMCVDYIDQSGQTSSVTDTWLFVNNNTIMKTETFAPGVALVKKCHTLPNVRGTQVWWGYNATRAGV